MIGCTSKRCNTHNNLLLPSTLRELALDELFFSFFLNSPPNLQATREAKVNFKSIIMVFQSVLKL